MPETVLITGATGFIGRRLGQALHQKNYRVAILSRSPSEAEKRLDFPARSLGLEPGFESQWEEAMEGAAAVVHLAGENISARRWTKKQKETIAASRQNLSRRLVQAIARTVRKPACFIQASAIGFYGSRRDEVLDESSQAGQGFLSEVCRLWEDSTAALEPLGIRRIIIRSGVVLGKEEGALPRLGLPFRFFLGGPLASGRQWVSWIQIKDEIKAIMHLLENNKATGVFNLCSPEPVTNREFSRTLGSVLHRPSWLPLPYPLLKIGLGDMASEVLLASQRVLPRRLLQSGYSFLFPELAPALSAIYTEDNQ